MTLIPSRRSFLTGLGASLIAAPAIVRVESLMPVRALPPELLRPVQPVLSIGANLRASYKWLAGPAGEIVDFGGDKLLALTIEQGSDHDAFVEYRVDRQPSGVLSFSPSESQMVATFQRPDGSVYFKINGQRGQIVLEAQGC